MKQYFTKPVYAWMLVNKSTGAYSFVLVSEKGFIIARIDRGGVWGNRELFSGFEVTLVMAAAETNRLGKGGYTETDPAVFEVIGKALTAAQEIFTSPNPRRDLYELLSAHLDSLRAGLVIT